MASTITETKKPTAEDYKIAASLHLWASKMTRMQGDEQGARAWQRSGRFYIDQARKASAA